MILLIVQTMIMMILVITGPHCDCDRDGDHVRVLVINGPNHDHDCDSDHVCIHEQNQDRDHDLNPALPTTTQENKLESLCKENTKFRAEEEKRRVDKSKLEKKRDNKVHSDHLAANAIKAQLKSNSCASKPVNQFGPLDI